MADDARGPELRAAVVRDRPDAPSAGVPHVGARVLLLVIVFALSMAVLALAIAGGRRPGLEPPRHAEAAARTGEGGVWVPLARVHGIAVAHSAPFDVSVDRWRVRWRVTPRAGVREHYLHVRVDGPPDALLTVSLDEPGEGSCVLHGVGARVLTVLSHHSYEVVAEEWRPTRAPTHATE